MDIYITKGLKIFSILLLESHSSLQWIFSLRRTWKETEENKMLFTARHSSLTTFYLKQKDKTYLLTMPSLSTKI